MGEPKLTERGQFLEWLERYQTLKKPLLTGHVSENNAISVFQEATESATSGCHYGFVPEHLSGGRHDRC
jgi:hypothetical protein